MSEEMKITFETKRSYKLPTLPNYIRTDDGAAIDIDTFTPQQLKEIGDKWTAALQTKANKRKGNSIMRLNKKLGNLG